MCGIIGYIGNGDAIPVIIDGLRKLEYRGYDSAGVAIIPDGQIWLEKKVGRLARLEENLEGHPKANIGIGHTRWATHGVPSDENSHPHMDCKGQFAVIHNGIIENYARLRQQLTHDGHIFKSQTDTEVLAHLVESCYQGDLVKAVQETVRFLEGSYALAVVSEFEPDKIVAVRKDSPLIVGIGENESFLASDIPAILGRTDKVYIMEDGEMAILDPEGVKLCDLDGNEIKKEVYVVTWDPVAAEKAGYPHFMIKEIHEQPKALRDTLRGRVADGLIDLEDTGIEEILEGVQKLFIVACGTAYHAGMVGKYVIERLVRIPVEVDIASEFRYRDVIWPPNSAMIVVSQSGETADTLAAMREAKKNGIKVIAVTNVVGSSVAREADAVLFTWAGPEIAVASTKAYVTQLLGMYLIALHMAGARGTLPAGEVARLSGQLAVLPDLVAEVLKLDEQIEMLAVRYKNENDAFFLGRGLDYAVGLEGALKLKEISYIHAEAYAAGELKHGTLALIVDGVPVISLVTQDGLVDKMISNIKEVKARGGIVIGITKPALKEHADEYDEVLYIPNTDPVFAPILSVVPLQLFAYYMAVARGCDVDKPRNLAKSVTVE
ncbi:MAG: glutamine--fructose-6-phosphate transaminase (isomerizing) [Solirubrobacterales bacterium]